MTEVIRNTSSAASGVVLVTVGGVLSDCEQ